MRQVFHLWWVTLLGCWALAPCAAQTGDIDFFDNRDDFIAATSAIGVSEPYQEENVGSQSATSGIVRFDPAPGSGLFFSNWPADFPNDNDVELAINGDENFDLVFLDGYVTALGIEFDPGDNLPGASEFTVAAMRGDLEVARLIFRESPSSPRGFVGISSPIAFDRLKIRERDAAGGNEYFGAVFARAVVPTGNQQSLIDAFESDNTPNTATNLGLAVIESVPDDQVDGNNITLSRAHSIHVAADEDWLLVPGGLPGDRIEVRVENPLTRVQVEAYSAARLTDRTLPLITVGDCAVAGFDEVGDFSSTHLLRVVPCPGTNPGYYQIKYTYLSGSNNPQAQAFFLFGQVTNGDDGTPAGVFVRASTGNVTFSSPDTGRYSMLLLRNRPHTISVISLDYEGDGFEISSNFNVERDILVNVAGLFSDSFE